MFMIKLHQDLEKDLLEIEQIDHHAGVRRDRSPDGDIQQVVVTMTGGPVAGAEHGAIARFIPLRIVIAVGCGEFDSFRQPNIIHSEHLSKYKGQMTRAGAAMKTCSGPRTNIVLMR